MIMFIVLCADIRMTHQVQIQMFFQMAQIICTMRNLSLKEATLNSPKTVSQVVILVLAAKQLLLLNCSLPATATYD